MKQMNDALPPKSKWNYKRIALFFAVFVGILWFAGSDNVPAKLKEICDAEARIIIYDPILWKKYKVTVEKQYIEIKRTTSNYRFSFSIKDSDFENYYELNNRFYIPGETIRDDRIISKDGKIVARIVNYSAWIRTFVTSIGYSCIIDHLELYNMELNKKQELSYE